MTKTVRRRSVRVRRRLVPGPMRDAAEAPPPSRVALRIAALRFFIAMVCDPTPAPLIMHGQERAFTAAVLAHEAPASIAARLNLSLEEMAGGCIRLLRAFHD